MKKSVMKTEKIKEVSEVLNSALDRSGRRERYYHWGIKPRKISQGKTPSKMTLPELEKAMQIGSQPQRQIPTVMELATLAAGLARTPCDNYEKLCGSALNLWFTSKEAIELQTKCNEDFDSADAKIEAERQKNPVPEPPVNQDWPIKLEQFTKILWPEKDTAERAEIIRAWLKSLPTNHPNPQMNGVSYATMNSEKISHSRFYFLRDSIWNWYGKWKLGDKRKKKSDAGKMGAKTKKEKFEKAYDAWLEIKELERNDESLAQFKSLNRSRNGKQQPAEIKLLNAIGKKPT
jgi:hypothetical protein